MLQRRLASSTHAILRSLQRRRERLEAKRQRCSTPASPAWRTTGSAPWTRLEDPDELDAEEAEQLEENVVDAATAAQTIAELTSKSTCSASWSPWPARCATAARTASGSELRALLIDDRLLRDETGARKLIIFTEHRDTLNYLVGDDPRPAGPRRRGGDHSWRHPPWERRESGRNSPTNPDASVLVATDAAGEGLNLQAAHLMINYDLPWNPNRIEQRFGRIHRIGQRTRAGCGTWSPRTPARARYSPGCWEDGTAARRLRRPAVRRAR